MSLYFRKMQFLDLYLFLYTQHFCRWKHQPRNIISCKLYLYNKYNIYYIYIINICALYMANPIVWTHSPDWLIPSVVVWVWKWGLDKQGRVIIVEVLGVCRLCPLKGDFHSVECPANPWLNTGIQLAPLWFSMVFNPCTHHNNAKLTSTLVRK